MSGYKLKEGKYSTTNLSDAEVWSSFEKVFSPKAQHSSSYKYIFLASIFKCTEEDKLTFSFTEVFSYFLEYYWILITKWHLRQETVKTRITEVEKIINDYRIMNPDVTLQNMKKEDYYALVDEIVKKCQTYVVGALYSDTNQQMYSFSKKEKYISINPTYKTFIQIHRSSLEDLLYYDLAKYYIRINDLEYFKWVKERSHIKYDDNLFFAREIIANVFEGKPDFSSQLIDKLNNKSDKSTKTIESNYEELQKYLDDPEELIRILSVSKGIKR